MPDIFSIDIKNHRSPETDSSAVGRVGEKLAAQFLTRAGYALVAANFKVPVGRNSRGAVVTGEIDLIAYDADVLCFVEVKTRTSDEFAAPVAAVDLRKQRQITRTARMYRKIFRLGAVKFRYDVVSVVLGAESSPRIELFKAFWTENKFAKTKWADDF